jgi:hypothetical protein
MQHFYNKVGGFFDFEEIYKGMVDNAKDGAKFVEIGSFLGKSTAYMGVEILNSGKKIQFDVVDMFDIKVFLNMSGNQWIRKSIDAHRISPNDTMLDIFNRNVEPIKACISNIRKGDSVELSKVYEDESLDFVFIDANHEYAPVRADILAWLPKVKRDGVIAGHDYHGDWPGVQRAVEEIFGQDVFKVVGRSWVCKKSDLLAKPKVVDDGRPFLSIVTRTHKRPIQLLQCLESISKMTDNDYENVLLVDSSDRGIGVGAANGMFARNKHRIHGKWVYILDDDNILIDNDLLKSIKKIDNKEHPDVIMFRISHEGLVLPEDSHWKKAPEIKHVDSSCLAVRKEIWDRHIASFNKPSCGDFFFARELYNKGYKFYWHDRVVMYMAAQHNGSAEH